MFLPRPIFIANLNDEAYYKRLYHLGDVGGCEIFFLFKLRIKVEVAKPAGRKSSPPV